MQTVITKADYDYHIDDLVANPPYSNYDMVMMLAKGQFIIEGKPSQFWQAEHFAQMNADCKDVWEALKAV